MRRVCFNKPFHDSIDSFQTNGLNVGLNNIVFYPQIESADVNHRCTEIRFCYLVSSAIGPPIPLSLCEKFINCDVSSIRDSDRQRRRKKLLSQRVMAVVLNLFELTEHF